MTQGHELAGDALCEGRRHQDRLVQRLAQCLDARYLVDRRPDDGEIQALRRADVPEGEIAPVQPGAERERRPILRHAILIDGGDPLPRVMHRGQRPGAGVGARLAGVVDREYGEHGVANELQHLAAMLDHGAGNALEKLVKGVQIVVAGQGVRQLGRAAEVGDPDHRVHVLAVTPLDETVHHPIAGVCAQVGPQQGQRGHAQRVGFELAAQARQDLVKMAQILGRESARPIRHHDDDVDLPVRES